MLMKLTPGRKNVGEITVCSTFESLFSESDSGQLELTGLEVLHVDGRRALDLHVPLHSMKP